MACGQILLASRLIWQRAMGNQYGMHCSLRSNCINKCANGEGVNEVRFKHTNGGLWAAYAQVCGHSFCLAWITAD